MGRLETRRTEPLLVVAYLMLLPEMCEAYRRLQSGKRHARLSPAEMLDLLIEVPSGQALARLATTLAGKRQQISDLREATETVRSDIDQAFAPLIVGAGSSTPPASP